MNFSSDNWAGASAPVAAALNAVNHGLAAAYGADDTTRTVSDWFAEIFERPVTVFFVSTGTAANSLALASVMRPGGAVICHRNAHVAVDEGGAPEFFSGGAKLVPVDSARGKLTPEGVRSAIARFQPPAVHHGRPVAVSLTQATEWGTVYSPAEVAAIAGIAHQAGLKVHMDGARFANALVSLNVTAAEMTWKAGVDMLSFGGTKNGCWCAEAVILFDPQSADDFAYARKRAGQLFSKSRFVAAQFQGYFDRGHWLDNAVHANAMAGRLAAGISAAPGARVLFQPEANEVFAIWSAKTSQALKAAGALFYEWPADGLPPADVPGEGEVLVRLVTSFATTKHDVAEFIRVLMTGSAV
ncbi:threonine aldolase family protein [Chthonobacter albigriseus]|uniref:threonine aldolase family protein n=1 Tax=Chthonobacter albigriseus TaxID=1683161 RepID=UPI0015EFAD3E|nr:low specificity L-threonine aldolase [Chthonobacter albigriseus]